MFSHVKKVLWAGCLAGVCIGVAGCAYHGSVRRGIYKPVAALSRQDASVLVLSDEGVPPKISITDPNSAALYGFTLDIADGVYVAATDALSSVIARADAGPGTLAGSYDFVARLKLTCALSRVDCTAELGELGAVQNGLCTRLTLTLYQTGSPQALGEFSARRWVPFSRPGAASVTRWINKNTLFLFSPILLPLYTQLQGATLRRSFEEQIKEILDEIVQEIRRREIFPANTSGQTVHQGAKNNVE